MKLLVVNFQLLGHLELLEDLLVFLFCYHCYSEGKFPMKKAEYVKKICLNSIQQNGLMLF